MKTGFEIRRHLLRLLIVIVLSLPCRVTAQSLAILHSFSGSDGNTPTGELTSSGNTLYGTTYHSVFRINRDGKSFTNLHSFFPTPVGGPDGLIAGVVLSDNMLYGTASWGGSADQGAVFAVKIDGTSFTNLHNFTDGIAEAGISELVLAGNRLYGTERKGGPYRLGTVFALNTDGTGYTNLVTFTDAYTNGGPADPYTGLVLSGDTLYGATFAGGSSSNGTVFKVNTDGSGYAVVHSFAGGNEGSSPYAPLILSSNTLYGTTEKGGTSGFGTVFRLNTDGTGFTNLHSFTSIDGASPVAKLLLCGSTLYGTASGGGSSGWGTAFAINIDGTSFTNLCNFTQATGDYPWAGLILCGNALFGTAAQAGTSSGGTVFSIAFLPRLTIAPTDSNVAFTWPTNVAGFDYGGYSLQSTTNLASPVWTTNLPSPVIVNGQYTVTNPISGTQQFFRLSQ